MGLLSLGYNIDYNYNSSERNKCCEYKFYRENADNFIKYCKDNNIEPYVIKNYDYDSKDIDDDDKLSNFNKARVLFKSNLRLRKPEGMGEIEFEKFLTRCLNKNYPQLEYYQKLADSINEIYYTGLEEMSIVFKPSFKWSDSRKSITKIGIRATTALNNTKKADRDALLEKYGLDKEKEKDVRASVPRLTLSLNNDEWFLENVDLYGKIYMNCNQDEAFTDKMREAIKKLFMRAYFDSTERNMVNHTWRDMKKSGVTKQDVDEQMRKLKVAIEKTCGKIYGTEIFLAESCVYLRVLQRLLESGRKCWLLYDCFYCSGLEGEDKETYSETIDRYIEESFNEYKKVEGK